MANPLIEKYNSNYDRAKMLINAGREKEALPYLKYALEALYTLAKESNYDPQKRKKYLELQTHFLFCFCPQKIYLQFTLC